MTPPKRHPPKTAEQINRKANLLMLIGDGYGAVTRFAEKCGKSQAYFWPIVNTDKGLGEAGAREIERALSLEPGWLDQDHSKKKAAVDLFASQLYTEASKRNIPDEMRTTIMHLLKSAPPKK